MHVHSDRKASIHDSCSTIQSVRILADNTVIVRSETYKMVCEFKARDIR